jgi:hypothetical protein
VLPVENNIAQHVHLISIVRADICATAWGVTFQMMYPAQSFGGHLASEYVLGHAPETQVGT